MDYDPSQPSDMFALRFTSLGFRKVLTIWREPSARRTFTITQSDWIQRPDILPEMTRQRMVSAVHRERLVIMIDRDIHPSPKRALITLARAPAPSETIDMKRLDQYESPLTAIDTATTPTLGSAITSKARSLNSITRPAR